MLLSDLLEVLTNPYECLTVYIYLEDKGGWIRGASWDGMTEEGRQEFSKMKIEKLVCQKNPWGLHAYVR